MTENIFTLENQDIELIKVYVDRDLENTFAIPEPYDGLVIIIDREGEELIDTECVSRRMGEDGRDVEFYLDFPDYQITVNLIQDI